MTTFRIKFTECGEVDKNECLLTVGTRRTRQNKDFLTLAKYMDENRKRFDFIFSVEVVDYVYNV